MKQSILFAMSALAVVACSKEQTPQNTAVKPYSVVEVMSQNVVGHTEYPASIEGKINNDVRAKI